MLDLLKGRKNEIVFKQTFISLFLGAHLVVVHRHFGQGSLLEGLRDHMGWWRLYLGCLFVRQEPYFILSPQLNFIYKYKSIRNM